MKADSVFYFTTNQVTERQDLEEGQYEMLLVPGKKKPWTVAIKEKWFLI